MNLFTYCTSKKTNFRHPPFTVHDVAGGAMYVRNLYEVFIIDRNQRPLPTRLIAIKFAVKT